MLWKSKVPEVMLSTYLEAKRQSEEARQNLAKDRLFIYYDNWDDLLKKVIEDQFDPKNYESMRFSRNISQNLLKKVVNETSLVYKDPPSRTIENSESTDKLYNEIIADLKLNTFMKKGNRLFSLLNDIIFQVDWDSEKDKIKLRMITPANATVIQDPNEPEEALALLYEINLIDSPYTGDDKVFVYWDSENHCYINERGIKRPIPGNEKMINPYGVLPFIFLHKDKIPGSFWNPSSGNDLVSATLINGLSKTLKSYLIKSQSFKQPWLKVNNKEDAPKQSMRSDPSSCFVVVGKDSEVGALNIQVNFASLDGAINQDINGALSTHGLSLDMFTAVEISGKALELKNKSLTNIREDQVDFFRVAEGELFELIRLVYNTHMGKNKLSSEAEFSIDYPELVFDEDPINKRDVLDRDLSKGVISIGKYAMALDPDIKNEKDGQEMIEKNLKTLNEIRGANFNINDGLQDEGIDVEEEE